MRAKLPKILVTGGAGFIGSVFVKVAIKAGHKVVIVDKLTYAGDLKRLEEVKGKFKFYKCDICGRNKISSIFAKERPAAVVNFAAETHVDRSIHNAKAFIQTNVYGTEVLLGISRKYNIQRFIHISSDEVYGDIKRGEFFEDYPLNPSSPYSAAKAAADLLLKSYIRTYSFPGIIVRPSNNYGLWQYPEKLIPLTILKILRKEKIPVYGNGKNVREWLYVGDCAKAVLKVLEKGRVGEIYNIGSNQEKQNIEVVKDILKILNEDNNFISFVKDRPGHDIRYRLNSRKISGETGWKPEVNFQEGLRYTVYWYLKNKDWLLNKWKNIAYLYKDR
mgnify:FL=1